MADKPLVKVVAEDLDASDRGKTEVYVVDPARDRVVRAPGSGIVVQKGDDKDRKIAQIKEQLERAGNRVEVVEKRR